MTLYETVIFNAHLLLAIMISNTSMVMVIIFAPVNVLLQQPLGMVG
ncbi:MAG: hypothetical protein ACE5D6_09080 [Candidatus Zixiibacteriota bacterium]